MDWLDRISIWAIVILIISSFAVIANHVGEAKPERHAQHRVAAPEVGEELKKKSETARLLIENGNLEKAEMLVNALIAQYPSDGEPHMLMGDILFRKQEPVRAIAEYKEAVNLNPDFLDKKTPAFQGKKLKKAAQEALAEIEKRMQRDPDSDALKKELRDIYYLQRRIAGSCS